MAGVCSIESDPASKAEAFVSSGKIKSISGNRDVNLEMLRRIIAYEILRQNPETKVIIIDRDFMGEHKVLTSGELGAALIDLTFGETAAVFITEDVPIIKWQEALQYLDRETSQVYYGSLGCGQVPVYVKLF